MKISYKLIMIINTIIITGLIFIIGISTKFGDSSIIQNLSAMLISVKESL